MKTESHIESILKQLKISDSLSKDGNGYWRHWRQGFIDALEWVLDDDARLFKFEEQRILQDAKEEKELGGGK
jgi:hypothetical protein